VEDVGSWVEVLRSLQGMEPDLVLAELRLALKGTAP
jgi:hypothetical protein